MSLVRAREWGAAGRRRRRGQRGSLLNIIARPLTSSRVLTKGSVPQRLWRRVASERKRAREREEGRRARPALFDPCARGALQRAGCGEPKAVCFCNRQMASERNSRCVAGEERARAPQEEARDDVAATRARAHAKKTHTQPRSTTLDAAAASLCATPLLPLHARNASRRVWLARVRASARGGAWRASPLFTHPFDHVLCVRAHPLCVRV